MSKNFMKKTLAGIFALAIVASSTPIAPFVPVMNSNSITASADTAPETDFDFDASSGTITAYTGEGGDVEIPSTIGGVSVTSIGESAFRYCSNLTSVTIPEGVTSIGLEAFRYCSNLTSVTIPKGVTFIDAAAFLYCQNLTSVTIPAGVTSISNSAFEGCQSLASVTIPKGVTSIGESAFAYCSSLASVTIPEGVTSIGRTAFTNCSSLTSVTIPESVISIGRTVFTKCSNLASVTAPCTLKKSMKTAMSDCKARITYTHSVANDEEDIYIVKCACGEEEIDYTAIFTLLANEDDFLKNVNSNDYTEDSWKALYDSVTALTEIVSDFAENVFVSAQSELTAAISAYNNAKDALVLEIETDFEFDASSGTITGYKGAGGDVKIPSTIGGVAVTSIGMSAFHTCPELTSVTIPEGVTSIGEKAFWDCYKLTSVTIPKGVTSIGKYAFQNCRKLTSVTIPKGVTSIDGFAFYACESLTSVTIPESVTGIGKYAFQNCYKLTSVTAPCTLKNSMSAAMGNCTATITYTHPGANREGSTYTVKCASCEEEIDYTAIFELLENEDVNPDDYTEDSWKAFGDAAAALEKIVSDFEENKFVSSQAELTAAISAYNDAKEALVLKDADYTAVNDAIDIVPNDLSIYTAASVSALENALDDVVYDLDITRQDEVDAMAKAIADAIDGLKLVADTTALEAAIADADAANEADYSASVWSAIQDKVAVGNTYVGAGLAADDVQGDVDEVTDDLYYLLLQKLNDADYTAVEYAIANIPDDLSIYTDASVDALIAAYNNVVRDLKEDKQGDVEAMAQAIESAIEDLILKDADYSAVDAAIDTVAATDRDAYTAASLNALDAAVAAVERDLDITRQDEVDAMAQAIADAIDGLVLKDADYTAVNDAIDIVPGDLSIYTAASVSALENALDDVVYDLDITRQDEVDAMAKAIADAIDGLKELADTSRLEAALADAYAANEADYSASVWSDIQDKVADGNPYVGAGFAADDVQGDVDAITDDLNALLLKKLNDADYTAVDAAINTIPDDLSIYTDASVDALIAAYNNVVRDLKEDKQGDVDAMAKAIEDATDALVLKDADYTEVEKYIAQAANIDRSLYTDDSLADLDAALANVTTDLKADEQAAVNAMATAIKDAIAALEEKPKYDTLYEEYLVTAPTVTETGTYNKRAYHYENDAKVVDTEKVFAENKAVTFEQWYLRTLIQYQTDGTTFDLRFVSMLDENLDQYQKAGFIFTINGTAVSDELSTVTANTSYIVDNEEVNISAFSEDNDYFFLQNYVFDISEIDLDASLAVTAYVVLADGTELQGVKAVTFTLRQFEC